MSNYLMHYNHNHDALGRFAGSTGSAVRRIGSTTTRKLKSSKRLAKKDSLENKKVNMKKPNKVVSNNKKKGAKSNNTKLSEADRRRLVEHGSAKEITKNKDRLSNRELEAAITRLQKEQNTRAALEKKLSDINNPSKQEVKSFVDKINDAGVKLNKVTDTVDKGIKAYNLAAKIHNSTSKDKWVIIGEDNDSKNTILEMQKVVMTGSAAEVWKNKGNMTPQQYENAKKRLQTDAEIKNIMNNEHKNNVKISTQEDLEKKKKKTYYYDSEGRKYTWYG